MTSVAGDARGFSMPRMTADMESFTAGAATRTDIAGMSVKALMALKRRAYC